MKEIRHRFKEMEDDNDDEDDVENHEDDGKLNKKEEVVNTTNAAVANSADDVKTKEIRKNKRKTISMTDADFLAFKKFKKCKATIKTRELLFYILLYIYRYIFYTGMLYFL